MYRYSGFALELAVWGVPGQPTTPTYACSRRTGRHQRHCWAWSWSACLGELLTTFCSLYRGGVAFLKVGVQNPASANEPENFRMYSLLEGYKILNLTPQFGVHRLCHYGGNLIVIEKCYSWQNWKKPSIYSWSVKWKKNYWHWCMDARNLHCRKLRTDRWKVCTMWW